MGLGLEPMEDGCVDRLAVLQVLLHNAFHERRRHPGIPNPLWVYDRDGAALTNAQARHFRALYPIRPEQQILTLQQSGQLRVQGSTFAIGAAIASGAHHDVVAIGIHDGQRRVHMHNLAPETPSPNVVRKLPPIGPRGQVQESACYSLELPESRCTVVLRRRCCPDGPAER